MNKLPAIVQSLLNNANSTRVMLLLAALANLLAVCQQQYTLTPADVWTVDGAHWALEHLLTDVGVSVAIVAAACVLAVCDTIRPLNKQSDVKTNQLARRVPEASRFSRPVVK